MQSFKILHLRHFHKKLDSIVIAAAARTPWGKNQGQLASVSGWQLGQIVVEAAVKQSAIPLDQIQEIFMNESPKLQNHNASEFIFSNFLKKTKYTPKAVAENEFKIEFFLKALELLKSQPHAAVVVGGLESASQNENIKNKHLKVTNCHNDAFSEAPSEIVQNCKTYNLTRFSKSQMDAIFESEIVPLKIPYREGKKTTLKEITQDEVLNENFEVENNSFPYSDGAAAVVLSTFALSKELQLSPLAVIADFEYLPNTTNILDSCRLCVEKVLCRTKLNPHQIKHWQIEDLFPQMVDFLKNQFNLNVDVLNPHCGSYVLGHSTAAFLTRPLTHLTHSLNPFEYGCVVYSSFQESLALIIQKLPFSFSPERLPVITLYTKDPCPLCDDLINELELSFAGEYELEKVFIDTKDNLRFLRLYRFDIPVLFLNNQFLCMHRLNHRLLRKRLDFFNKNKLLKYLN